MSTADAPPLSQLTTHQAEQVIANLKPCYELDLVPSYGDELRRVLLQGGGHAPIYGDGGQSFMLVIYPAKADRPLAIYLCDSGYWAHHLATSSANEFVRIEERVATVANGDRIYLGHEEDLIFYVEPSHEAGKSHVTIFREVRRLDLDLLLREAAEPEATSTSSLIPSITHD